MRPDSYEKPSPRGPDMSGSGAAGRYSFSGTHVPQSAVLVINGNVTIQVVHGDITEEKTDALVNGTNKSLNMGMELNVIKCHDTLRCLANITVLFHKSKTKSLSITFNHH